MIESTAISVNFDPWGPILAALVAKNDAVFFQTAIEFGGVVVEWPTLDERSNHSPKTRIQAFRPAIQSLYSQLPDEEKGQFAQNVVSQLWKSLIGQNLRTNLLETLKGIGWTITEDGLLTTQDSLISEHFFPAGSAHDAYVAIRSILLQASRKILIVDAYLGRSLFMTLKAAPKVPAVIELLTSSKAIEADLKLEANAFLQQFPSVKLEVRTTSDFHDRFMVIDDNDYYHVGASLKDAGKGAFLLSHIRDQPVIDLLKVYIEQAWDRATKSV